MENQSPVVETTIDIEIKRTKKGELIDAIASHSKLSKADAGRQLNASIEEIIIIKIDPCCDNDCYEDCPKVELIHTTKITPTTK